MSTPRNFSALPWIKDELNELMQQASHALEGHIEDTDDQARIQTCIEKLHQIYGTLRMAQLFGASMLAEEMELAANALKNGKVSQRSEVAEVLLQALAKLSAYLDKMQSGYRDIPLLTLPIMNELRAARDADLLSEVALFAPALEQKLKVELPQNPENTELSKLARRLRHSYHKGLLSWYRAEKHNQGLSILTEVMDKLGKEAGTEPVRRLFQIAGAAIAALQDKTIEPGIAVKLLFGRLDRQIKLLIDESEQALINIPATELQKNLLYYIALSDSDNDRVQTIKHAFELDVILPIAEEIEVGQKELSEPDHALLNLFCDAIQNDLTQLQNRLDRFIRSAPQNIDDLLDFEQPLRKIADTLGMVGQGELRERMKIQADWVSNINKTAVIPSEAELSGMAEDILLIEKSMNNWVATLAFPVNTSNAQKISITLDQENEFGILVQTVFREACVDITNIKQAITTYIEAPAKDLLLDISKRFFDTAGAFKMLNLMDVSVLLDFTANYISKRFVAEDLIFDSEEINTLADAITGIEYYMEAVIEDRSDQVAILEIARQALIRLGWNQENRVGLDSEMMLETVFNEVELQPESESLHEPENSSLDELGFEIVEIFVEEAKEELVIIQEHLPKLRKNPDESEVLVTLRRSFHTLKGSGRMVGAQTIGELAWAVENLLNRIIDQTVLVSASVLKSLDDVVDTLPDLINQQTTGELTNSAHIQPLIDQVFKLAESLPSSEPEEIITDLPEATDAAISAPQISMETKLFGIFKKETKEHIAAIEDSIDICSTGGSRELGEKISRAFHTLHGSSHMAGVDSMAQISGVFEAFTNKLIAAEKPLNEDRLALITQGLKNIETLLTSINQTVTEQPDWQTFVAEVEQHISDLDGEKLHPDEPNIKTVLENEEELASEFLEITEEPLPDGGGLLLEEYGLEIMPGTEAEIGLELLDDITAEPLPEGTDLLLMEPDPEIGSKKTKIVKLETRDDASKEELLDESFATNAEELTSSSSSKNHISSVAQAATETEGEEEIDEELLSLFFEEAHEQIAVIESAVQEWSCDPMNPTTLPALLRALHTLKGGSRLAGIIPIGDLSHAFESLLEGVNSGEVATSTELLGLIHQVTDRLLEEIDGIGKGAPTDSTDNLIANLEKCLVDHGVFHEESLPSTSEPQAEYSSDNVPDTTVEIKDETDFSQPADSARLPTSGTEVKKGQIIRVHSEQLDLLVNHAGEISIFRARLEQQNNDLSFNLSELDQTVTRLHEQLRNLDIETEAQILFRYEREKETDEEHLEKNFDPLELDRFSNMQQLSRALIESVSDLASIKDLMDELARDNETLLLQQSRVATDLQDSLLRTRMVPFSQLLPKLQRLVRQTCTQLKKNAILTVHGAEGEMDRGILDHIIAPLEHILRNAISHGIEFPHERTAAGKNKAGTITLTLSREGTDVLLVVADDGGGLKLEHIRRRAIEKGLLAKDSEIADNDLMQLILEPGFSTSDEITQISGRGIGMDVVVSELKQMSGSLGISSQSGQGTTFTIRLPLTLAISDTLLVQLNENIYAIPHASIEGVVRLAVVDLQEHYDGIRENFTYAGRDYQVRYLGNMLGTSAPHLANQKKKWLPMLLVRSGEHRIALQVDGLLGHRQIVVKPVGSQLSSVRWITGGTILGDGSVALILDVNALVRTMVTQPTQAVEPSLEALIPTVTTVMVVDDSITVRKVTTRFLERHNMRVITAKDGVDAVEKLQVHKPDVILLDIEMPRMDGFEVARHMRNSPGLRDIPIIMITSRSGDKHRSLAMQLGVKGYLGKPYQEVDLLQNINELLAETAE